MLEDLGAAEAGDDDGAHSVWGVRLLHGGFVIYPDWDAIALRSALGLAFGSGDKTRL